MLAGTSRSRLGEWLASNVGLELQGLFLKPSHDGITVIELANERLHADSFDAERISVEVLDVLAVGSRRAAVGILIEESISPHDAHRPSARLILEHNAATGVGVTDVVEGGEVRSVRSCQIGNVLSQRSRDTDGHDSNKRTA